MTQTELAERIVAYLADAPMDGQHSDAAGANAYELLEEAASELRAARTPREAERNAVIEECAMAIAPKCAAPCDCITTLKGSLIQECCCRNEGDLAAAQSWCDDMNNVARIRALTRPASSEPLKSGSTTSEFAPREILHGTRPVFAIGPVNDRTTQAIKSPAPTTLSAEAVEAVRRLTELKDQAPQLFEDSNKDYEIPGLFHVRWGDLAAITRYLAFVREGK